MYFSGIVIGLVCFICIGLFHPLVIKAEYYFSKNIWWLFALAGIVLLLLSVFVEWVVPSACLAVVGMCCLWSIKELFDQEKRVKEGRFPKNPKRKY